MKAEKIGTENSVDAEGSQKYKEWVVVAAWLLVSARASPWQPGSPFPLKTSLSSFSSSSLRRPCSSDVSQYPLLFFILMYDDNTSRGDQEGSSSSSAVKIKI